jgi:hypothetical protein
MLGHKWEPAQGIIVRAETVPQHKHHHGADALRAERKYVVEVRKPNGDLITGTVVHSGYPLAAGTTVQVEVHSKNNEIRLDPNAAAGPAGGMSMSDQIRDAAAAFDGRSGAAGSGIASMPGSAGGVAPGLAGLLGALGAAQGSVHVLGPGGQPITMSAAQGNEITQLAQAMMSGDPAARQAAVERIHQIKAEFRSQVPGQPHLTPPPANSFDQPASTFGQPAASSFDQPAPPTSGSMSAFDASDTGGTGTAEQRIAMLAQQLDRGILTQSEFEARRQQILSGG